MNTNTSRNLGMALAALLLAATAGPVRAEGEDLALRARRVCVACHGEGGRSDVKLTPSLAGQTREYLAAQMKDFRGQIRAETGRKGYMWGVSALLDDATIAGLAEYFAAQVPARGRPGDPALVEAGRRLFVDGAPTRGVRACASCHGEGGGGAKAVPRLAGQHADYVTLQLKEFGTALRPHAQVMREEVQALTDAEMRALAEYVQSR